MKVLRPAWKVCGWCTWLAAHAFLVALWLVLLAALAGQIHLLSSRRVPVPEPLRRLVEQRLAEHGVHFGYGEGSMDFAGHLLLQDVRLADSEKPSETLASANVVYANLDAWALLVGTLDIKEVRINGLSLHVPASLSDTGAAHTPVSGFDASIHPDGPLLSIAYLSGRVGDLPVHLSGSVRLPQPPAQAQPKGAAADRALLAWISAARRITQLETHLAAARNPRLHLRLNPATVNVEIDLDSFEWPKTDALPAGKVEGIRLTTTLPLEFPLADPVELRGRVASLSISPEAVAANAIFRLHGGTGGSLPKVELQLGSVRWRDIETGPLFVSAAQTTADDFAADLSLSLADGAWSIQTQVAPARGSARIRLDGFVGDAALAFAGARIGKNLTDLLDPVQEAPLNVEAEFLPGWKLGKVTGRLHSGFVRVGDANLDETGTEFTYDGARVLADNLVLRQGGSLAHGSYEMDTKNNRFRFLLTGGLRPLGISGWFHEWWSNFWTMFDFDRSIPAADVDVQGRWGDRFGTHVFVQADGADIGLKGVAFDRVATRLFLRPHWFDILNFKVVKDGRFADGWLSRSLDDESETWNHMEFAVDSTLPLPTITTLFKAESEELLAPYRFEQPPALRLQGRVDSPASPKGKHESIDIKLTSKGPMTYHGFPLSDLNVDAIMRDDRINLPALSVNFAGGRATGNARLWGAEQARRLSFDIKLDHANLGAVTQAVNTLEETKPVTTGKPAAPNRATMERLERGTLDFALAAEGDFAKARSFKGRGRATISGAELAQLNLFGPLSEALRGTFINFGTFSITQVEAPFELHGSRVHFEELRATGPSALIQAKGDYFLPDSRLDFTAKLHPFEESSNVVGNAVGFVLTPLSKVFEVKLQGTLAKPSWIFAYGPSRFFNSISPAPKSQETPAKPTPLLQP